MIVGVMVGWRQVLFGSPGRRRDPILRSPREILYFAGLLVVVQVLLSLTAIGLRSVGLGHPAIVIPAWVLVFVVTAGAYGYWRARAWKTRERS